MSREADKAIIRRFFEEVVNRRNYDVVDEVIAPDFVLHSAVLGEVRGAAAYKESVVAVMSPGDGFQVEIGDLVAGENGHLTVRLTYHGRDNGGLLRGQSATGRPFAMTALYLWRLENGKAVELWQEADRLGMIQQLQPPAEPA